MDISRKSLRGHVEALAVKASQGNISVEPFLQFVFSTPASLSLGIPGRKVVCPIPKKRF
jgi:hypothetical protein